MNAAAARLPCGLTTKVGPESRSQESSMGMGTTRTEGTTPLPRIGLVVGVGEHGDGLESGDGPGDRADSPPAPPPGSPSTVRCASATPSSSRHGEPIRRASRIQDRGSHGYSCSVRGRRSRDAAQWRYVAVIRWSGGGWCVRRTGPRNCVAGVGEHGLRVRSDSARRATHRIRSIAGRREATVS